MSGHKGIEVMKSSVSIDGDKIDLSVSPQGEVVVEGKLISVTVKLEIKLSKEDRAALLACKNREEVDAKQGVEIKITSTGDGNQICLDVVSEESKLPGRFVKLFNKDTKIVLEVCDADGNQIINNDKEIALKVLRSNKGIETAAS